MPMMIYGRIIDINFFSALDYSLVYAWRYESVKMFFHLLFLSMHQSIFLAKSQIRCTQKKWKRSLILTRKCVFEFQLTFLFLWEWAETDVLKIPSFLSATCQNCVRFPKKVQNLALLENLSYIRTRFDVWNWWIFFCLKLFFRKSLQKKVWTKKLRFHCFR